MKLIADVCRINVVLPGEGGEGAVVRGAAMLGRFAAEVKEATRREERAELLWKIMASVPKCNAFDVTHGRHWSGEHDAPWDNGGINHNSERDTYAGGQVWHFLGEY